MGGGLFLLGSDNKKTRAPSSGSWAFPTKQDEIHFQNLFGGESHRAREEPEWVGIPPDPVATNKRTSTSTQMRVNVIPLRFFPRGSAPLTSNSHIFPASCGRCLRPLLTSAMPIPANKIPKRKTPTLK